MADVLLGAHKWSSRTCVHMVMLILGCAGCSAARFGARVAGRSSAAAGPSCSDRANMAPHTASAVSAAAPARLRLRRSMCAAGEGATPPPASMADP